MLLLGSMTMAQTTIKPKPSQVLLVRNADAAFDAKHYAHAIAAYEEALSKSTDNVALHLRNSYASTTVWPKHIASAAIIECCGVLRDGEQSRQTSRDHLGVWTFAYWP
jgi:hypothetical protein